MAIEAGKYFYFLLIVIPTISIILGLIIFFVVSLKESYIADGIENKVYQTQAIYSPECFAYQDKISGRVYPGVIDVNKFNEKILRNCIPLMSSSQQAIMVELTLKDGTNIPLTTANWDNKRQREIETYSFTVNVKDLGPALITFHHIK